MVKFVYPLPARVLRTVCPAHRHYDPSQTCSGNEGLKEYTCYTDAASKAFPVNRMFKYLNATAAAVPPADGTLYAMQALWEESAETVAIGE